MLQSIIAILGGAIAAAPFITSKSPSSSGYIKSIEPYRGYIGVALLVWGILGILRLLSNGLFNNHLMAIVTPAAMFIVGFSLAYELIQQFLLKDNVRANEVGQNMKNSLTNFQIPAGLALIVLGIISFF